MSTFRVVPPMCAGNKQRTRPHVWNFQGLHRQGRKEDSLTRLPIYKHANAIRLCWQPANQFGRQWRRSSSKFVSCRKEENLCVQNTERRSRCCHRVTASLPEKWVFGSVHSSRCWRFIYYRRRFSFSFVQYEKWKKKRRGFRMSAAAVSVNYFLYYWLPHRLAKFPIEIE